MPRQLPRLGTIDGELLRLALPALATLVAEPLYVLTDTAIVGHLGTDQLAGLAVASTVLVSGFSLFLFLAYGTTSSVARLLGAGRRAEAAEQAVQGLWLAAGLGAVAAIVVAAATPALVHALGGRGVVAQQATIYLRLSVPGFPALLVSLAGVGYLRGLQDTRTPLAVAVGTALANLGLEAWWIYGLGLGIGASAVATVVAQWVGGAVYIGRIVAAVRAFDTGLRPRWAVQRQLLGVGVHLAMRTAALRGVMMLGTAAAARLGTGNLAAYQVGFEVWSFLALALDALAIAAQALVGRSLGAGDVDHARAVGRRAVGWSVGVGLVFAAAVALGRGPLAAIFSNDDAVLAAARWSLLWVAITQPLNGWVFALDGVLIGAGDQRYLARAMAAAFVLSAPPLLWVGVTRPGLGWLWAALLWFMAARLAVLQGRYQRGGWAVVGAGPPTAGAARQAAPR